mgnify:CR=1 FL=1|tara:strand:+ start:26589 stop:27416 length:828 start_codon:yes stop_codon:yes gene_type:complete
MDQLIARVKGRSRPHYYKLLSDTEIYQIDTENLSMVEYEPGHLLDEDSWFNISNFSQKPYCIELLTTAFVSADYNDIPASKYGDLAFLCSVQNGNYFFQKVTPSLFVTRRSLTFGENVSYEEDKKRLFINEVPDAVYISESDSLIFRNLATISSIFKGIDTLFKEATQEEVESFLNKKFIELASDYSHDKVSKPNRKRIGLAMSVFDRLAEEEKSQIFEYIDEYCPTITYDGEEKKFTINSDNELKLVLYGLEERFYTTFLGNEKRLANSIQTLA